jgi:hypothetical protein
MKKRILVLATTILTGVVMAGLVGGEKAAAQEQQNQPAAVTYKYVAQPGDSYTKMARKAVQTYGKKHKAEVSLAGVIFAETKLTKEAGSPKLSVGQNVEISEQTVKSWIEQAQKLTTAQQSAWNYYVQFVDFNTDRVGQAS